MKNLRIAISAKKSDHGIWALWTVGGWGKWTVIRTCDPRATIPAGFTQVRRDHLLPVSDAERRRELDRISLVRGMERLTAEERIRMADHDVRVQRGDPSHNWYAWNAPLRLSARAAGTEWVDAVALVTTTHSHVVLRPNIQGGWLAWLGLGSHLEPVTPAGYIPRRLGGAKRLRSVGGAPRVRVGPPAYWPSRDEARDAAIERVRSARAELIYMLPGWSDEARKQFLSGEENARMRVFGAQILSPEIQIHEGPASGGGSSWDLPVVETVRTSALIV